MYDDCEFEFGPSFEDAIYVAELTADSDLVDLDELFDFETDMDVRPENSSKEVDAWANQAMASNGFGG